MTLLMMAILIMALTTEVALAPVEVSPERFDFGTAAIQLTGEVWTSGSRKMCYVITDDADWLTVSPTSGESSGERDTITVTVDRAGLAVGTYTGTITVKQRLPGD
ncbi:unnamed protein product, partial [marine sediment metagenome]